MKDTSVRVGIYRRVGRGDPGGGEYGLHQIREDEPLFTKPTLLCCGGGGTHKSNEDHARLANGYAKIGHGLLSFKDTVGKDDPIDIIAVAYPGDTLQLQDGVDRLTRRTLAGKASYGTAADNFMYDYIDPLLTGKSGGPRDMDSIKRSLRNIHILAHSYGGAFVRELGNALHARLKELFPNPQDAGDIREAMAQVLVVTGGTVAPLGAGKTAFTTIDVLNAQDEISGQHYPGEDMQKRLIHGLLKRNGRMHKEIDGMPARPLTVMPMRMTLTPKTRLRQDAESRHCLVYAGQPVLRSDKDFLMGEAMDAGMPRSNACGYFHDDKTGGPPAVERDETYHQAPTYFYYGAGTHGFMLRTAVSSALANGINNAIRNQKAEEFIPLAEPTALLKCPKRLLYPLATVKPAAAGDHAEALERDFTKVARAIDYNNRIAAACGEHSRLART